MNINSDMSDRTTVDPAVEDKILARMKQRTDEIAQRSEKRRNEQINRNTELETADAFLTSFSEMKDKLVKDLCAVEEIVGDKEKVMDHFDKIVRDHGFIQQYLNESSMFLASFQVKRSQEALAELYVEIQQKMEDVQPKKRFGFASKNRQTRESKNNKENADTADGAVANREGKLSALDKILAQTFFGFQNNTGEKLKLTGDEISNRQLNLRNLDKCTVEILGTPGTVQVDSLTDCTVVIGPTSRSAFIKNCKQCTFVMACQQVRIHDTADTQFYLHVTGAAIIESCSNVGFAPYNLDYPLISEHYQFTGLDRSINNWDNVEDFKWISKHEKSPNMYLIPQSERKSDWL